MNFARVRNWHRSLLWTFAGAVWIAILLLPGLALLLAVRGELSLQPGEHQSYRVWLVVEQEERGLGWEVRREASRSVERVCLQTTVGFLLWRGQSQQIGSSFCECYRQRPGAEMEYLGACAVIQPD